MDKILCLKSRNFLMCRSLCPSSTPARYLSVVLDIHPFRPTPLLLSTKPEFGLGCLASRRGNLLSNRTSRAWMLSLTPGQSLVKSNLRKWGLTATAQCDCGHGDETFLHQQLHCHLTHRRNMKQTAHNNVAKVIENQVQHINAETRHATR